jgi:2'-5' RNA ligase
VAATAIVMPFPEVEALAGRHRRSLTADGADGMPAHVTLIYPFADGAALGDHEIGQVGAALAGVTQFDVTFAGFGRFAARPPVLYLEPRPGDEFLDMIAALERGFPAFPPFGGLHETVIPHLTIAQTDDATAMRAAQDDVERHLPIRTRAAEVAVMEHLAGGWQPRARVALPPPV